MFGNLITLKVFNRNTKDMRVPILTYWVKKLKHKAKACYSGTSTRLRPQSDWPLRVNEVFGATKLLWSILSALCVFELGEGGEDISRPSLCHGAACGFVWHQQGPSCGRQGDGGQETPHPRSLSHVAAVGDGGRRAVARPLHPPLNGCHGVWLHSDYGMMDYDDGGPFSA